MQDRVDVAEAPRVTLVELNVQVSPAVGETDCVSATVPLNPNIELRVIVEVPGASAMTVTLVGFAVIE